MLSRTYSRDILLKFRGYKTNMAVTLLRKLGICNTPTHRPKKNKHIIQTATHPIPVIPCTQRDERTKSKWIKRHPSNLIEIKPTIKFVNVSNLPARRMTVGHLNCRSARNKAMLSKKKS